MQIKTKVRGGPRGCGGGVVLTNQVRTQLP
ncbi:hypothetical protein SAMN05443572_110191 [Myxococcus fulvus]|jgi:hypothetical protein|uniref:Lipoprotein n=1 Tax=Myxococcus fulvus TaxID=33 RepID=A0ABY1CRY9_MYXFU|nr:hypothetical protein MFUL124B02_14295 [Myxococcus fulvus 124B02]SEU35065.1 hypothetical protein SAMN05443572_110191 [Myxococcus fulvus]